MTADINQELIRISEISKVDLLHIGDVFSSVGVWLYDRIVLINYSDREQAYENFRMLRIAIKYYK